MSILQELRDVHLTEISCGECGGVYAINERLRQRHEEKGTAWNCPYCRTGWGYSGRGTLAAKEKELAAEKERHQRTLARLNAEEVARGKAERKLKRVQRGVCPCCNRTFQDLARHMATKHPEKAETAPLAAPTVKRGRPRKTATPD